MGPLGSWCWHGVRTASSAEGLVPVEEQGPEVKPQESGQVVIQTCRPQPGDGRTRDKGWLLRGVEPCWAETGGAQWWARGCLGRKGLILKTEENLKGSHGWRLTALLELSWEAASSRESWAVDLRGRSCRTGAWSRATLAGLSVFVRPVTHMLQTEIYISQFLHL